MGLISTTFATLGKVTSVVPVALAVSENPATIIILPSDSMPKSQIHFTNLYFSETVDAIWHDISWNALAASTKKLYTI